MLNKAMANLASTFSKIPSMMLMVLDTVDPIDLRNPPNTLVNESPTSLGTVLVLLLNVSVTLLSLLYFESKALTKLSYAGLILLNWSEALFLSHCSPFEFKAVYNCVKFIFSLFSKVWTILSVSSFIPSSNGSTIFLGFKGGVSHV